LDLANFINNLNREWCYGQFHRQVQKNVTLLQRKWW
jgi:hypothetical protein